MTTSPMERFDYVEADPALGSASALPYVPITLQYGDREIKVPGLVGAERGTRLFRHESEPVPFLPRELKNPSTHGFVVGARTDEFDGIAAYTRQTGRGKRSTMLREAKRVRS